MVFSIYCVKKTARKPQSVLQMAAQLIVLYVVISC